MQYKGQYPVSVKIKYSLLSRELIWEQKLYVLFFSYIIIAYFSHLPYTSTGAY